MNIEEEFQKVEKVLANFPCEYTKNYFDNKTDLKIQKDLNYSYIQGLYDDKNIITLYCEDAISHELFHMAFRDREKVNKKIKENEYYSNGVMINVNNKILINKGLTEGFAEYLARKCNHTQGQQINYFFVNLLINIYGEDILKYPLLNDPIGLLSDDRFLNIAQFSKNIDIIDNIIIIEDLILIRLQILEETLKNNNKILKEISELLRMYKRNNKEIKSKIISMFKCIINEYNHCKYPKINADEFVELMQEFLEKDDYNFINKIDEKVKDDINIIINKFKKSKIKSLN